MNEEEKILRTIDLAQTRIKILSDIVIKLIIFHLGITAFSITFSLKESNSSFFAIQILNIALNIIVIIITVSILGDAKRMVKNIIDLHNLISVPISQEEYSGVLRSAHFYLLFSILILSFWCLVNLLI